MKIGVLALQGAVAPHRAKLAALGHEAVAVRASEDLAACRGLIVPGGESTTMLKLIRDFDLRAALLEFAARRPVWGICAGAILIAETVENPAQESLALLPIAVRRNAYGRQNESFIAEIAVTLPGAAPARQEAVFIRAPVITRHGPEAGVLAGHGGHPVALCQGRHMATTFHPELSTQDTLHRFFAALCSGESERLSA